MNAQMINEARHILMNFLIKGKSTSYGLNYKTSVTQSVAQLRKDGYLDVTGTITLTNDNLTNTIDYFYVRPTQKLLDIKESLIIYKNSLEKLIETNKNK